MISLQAQRVDVAAQLEAMVEIRPLSPVLTSMPGVAVRTAAINIAEISGKNVASAASLSSCAGLRQPRASQAPRSGSIQPAGPTTSGNVLKANATTKHSSHWPTAD